MRSGFEGIALAGESIVRSLKTAFEVDPPLLEPAAPHAPRKVEIRQVAPHELEKIKIGSNVLTLLLYRVDVNRAMRAGFSAVRGSDGRYGLALDLFYLLTAWSANAVDEQLMLGRAMQALAEATPLSGISTLNNVGGGGRPDVEIENLSMIIDELSNEAMMRIFDAFPVKYRLSVPYIGRLTRIALSEAKSRLPVLEGNLKFLSGVAP